MYKLAIDLDDDGVRYVLPSSEPLTDINEAQMHVKANGRWLMVVGEVGSHNFCCERRMRHAGPGERDFEPYEAWVYWPAPDGTLEQCRRQADEATVVEAEEAVRLGLVEAAG